MEKTEEWKFLIEKIEKEGIPVKMDTLECIMFSVEHPSCKGCVTEIVCMKYVGIHALFLQTLLYKATSFEDQMRTYKYVSDRVMKILKAKTTDELRDMM